MKKSKIITLLLLIPLIIFIFLKSSIKYEKDISLELNGKNKDSNKNMVNCISLISQSNDNGKKLKLNSDKNKLLHSGSHMNGRFITNNESWNTSTIHFKYITMVQHQIYIKIKM